MKTATEPDKPRQGRDASEPSERAATFTTISGRPIRRLYTGDDLRGLEYRRDIGRFLNSKQDSYPAAPSDYFDAASAAALEALRERAIAGRDPALTEECRRIQERANVSFDRRGAATTIFRNWLGVLARARTAGVPASA